MLRFLPALILLASLRPAFALTAADLGDEIQHLSLDPAECYRVLDLNFNKEDVKVYLASGYLIFTKPDLQANQGTHLGAIFVASADGGDADVLLLPPTRSERSSLATFTNSPNLEEHFKSAAFIFTDGTGDDLLAQLQNNPASKKSPEMGGLIAESWTSVVSNLISSFETRVVYDVLSGQRDTGIFYLAVSGKQLDNFDVLYDPTAQDQILVGKLGYRNNRTYFNTWTAFQARSFRNGAPAARRSLCARQHSHRSRHPTRSDHAGGDARHAHFATSAAAIRLALQSVAQHARHRRQVDGKPAEVFDRASLRSDLIQASEDRQFLLVCGSRARSRRPARDRNPSRRRRDPRCGQSGLLCRLARHLVSANRRRPGQLRLDIPLSKEPDRGGHRNARGRPHRRRLARHAREDGHSRSIRRLQSRQLPVRGSRAQRIQNRAVRQSSARKRSRAQSRSSGRAARRRSVSPAASQGGALARAVRSPRSARSRRSHG